MKIYPPATIGIMGGGQLGKFFALEAAFIGYEVILYDPNPFAPARFNVKKHFIADYNDLTTLKQFTDSVAIVTVENENIPLVTLEFIEQQKKLYPNFNSIKIASNRELEKQLFKTLKIPTVKTFLINNKNDCKLIPLDMFPVIIKTTSLGYDGKGQITANNHEEALQAYLNLKEVKCIAEEKVQLIKELSIIIASNGKEISYFDPFENIHVNGILRQTISPASVTKEEVQLLIDYSTKIIQHLDYIGLLTIEFFLTAEKGILANEIAPRPHNSGHITLNNYFNSQFMLQVRSICRLPLLKNINNSFGTMFNILGEHYPLKLEELDIKNSCIYLYGKEDAKIGRKMGHLNIVGDNLDDLEKISIQVKKILF